MCAEDDLVTRLRSADCGDCWGAEELLKQGADEIERLRPMAESWQSYEAAQDRKSALTSNLVTLADELCKAAVSHAGDTGLHHEAWLWQKIEAYQAARRAHETKAEFIGGKAGVSGEHCDPNGWEPIATAPRNGKWVLLWWPYVTNAAFAGYYANRMWHGATSDADATWNVGPTHWQHLPAGPTLKTKAECRVCHAPPDPACQFARCPQGSRT